MLFFMGMIMFFFRILTIGSAVGILFVRCSLFPEMQKWKIVMFGVCSASLFSGFLNYLLGLVFIGWPVWFFYIVPLVLAFVWISHGSNVALLRTVSKEGWGVLCEEIRTLGKWRIVDFVLSIGFVCIFAISFYGFMPVLKKIIAPYPLLLTVIKFTTIILLAVGIFIFARQYKGKKNKGGLIVKNCLVVFFLQ